MKRPVYFYKSADQTRDGVEMLYASYLDRSYYLSLAGWQESTLTRKFFLGSDNYQPIAFRDAVSGGGFGKSPKAHHVATTVSVTEQPVSQ